MPATLERTKSRETPDRLWTVADLAALPDELPTGPAYYELDNGKLIIMSPPGDLHGAVESNLNFALKFYGDKRGLGKVRCGEVAIVLWRNPDRVVGADAVFIANSQLPIRKSPEGYLLTIPHLVAEVVSPNDRPGKAGRKIRDYLKAGVQVVLVADPQRGTVTVHRPEKPDQIFRGGEAIDIEDVIPGFTLTANEALAE
jgi:Uma2 family endonuclease